MAGRHHPQPHPILTHPPISPATSQATPPTTTTTCVLGMGGVCAFLLHTCPPIAWLPVLPCPPYRLMSPHPPTLTLPHPPTSPHPQQGVCCADRDVSTLCHDAAARHHPHPSTLAPPPPSPHPLQGVRGPDRDVAPLCYDAATHHHPRAGGLPVDQHQVDEQPRCARCACCALHAVPPPPLLRGCMCQGWLCQSGVYSLRKPFITLGQRSLCALHPKAQGISPTQAPHRAGNALCAWQTPCPARACSAGPRVSRAFRAGG